MNAAFLIYLFIVLTVISGKAVFDLIKAGV